MNSFHEFDTIKLEKQKAMQRYNTFKKISNIVRTFEIVVAISLFFYSISLSSTYFPAAVEIFGAFYRRVSSLFFSPHFVFFIGNAIIVTLFAKSSAEKNTSENSGGDEIFREATENVAAIVADSPVVDTAVAPVVNAAVAPVVNAAAAPVVEEKSYRRSKSSVEMVVVKVQEKKELRRSVTQVRRENEKSPAVEKTRDKFRFEEDELSNEEFRKKVEAFIEKQQRKLREEKLAVVVSN